MYKSIIEKMSNIVSADRARRIAEKTNAIERFFSFSSFHKSAALLAKEMKKIGVEQVEIIPVPADGKKIVWDFVMPLAWDIKNAKLEIVNPGNFKGRILAEYLKEPISTVLWCAPTPKEGIEVEVISEHKMKYSGPGSVRGKAVLTSKPSYLIKREVAENGGLGIITYASNSFEQSNELQWVNVMSDGPGWWVLTAKDSQMWAFVVSPQVGKELEAMIENSGLIVKATADTRIYKGSFDIVTGVIKGREKPDEEVWLIAHLYEPFPSDDACGAAGGIEILRTIKEAVAKYKCLAPKRTIRLIMTWENYGFAAYIDYRKRNLPKVLGAMSLDGICCNQRLSGMPTEIKRLPDALGLFTDPLLCSMVNYYFPKYAAKYKYEIMPASCNDDPFIALPSIGIPTNFIYQPEGVRWHSTNNDWSFVDMEMYRHILTFDAAYIYLLSVLDKSDADWLGRLTIAEAQNKIIYALKKDNRPDVLHRIKYIRDLCGKRISSLKTLGMEKTKEKELNLFIDDFAKKEIKLVNDAANGNEGKLSADEKYAQNFIPSMIVPGGAYYGYARIPVSEKSKVCLKRAQSFVSWVDGKRNLYEIIKLVEQELEITLSSHEIREVIGYFDKLDKYGYIKLKRNIRLTRKDIVSACQQCGLKKGDIVFVHSSLRNIGYIKGGPQEVIRALLDVIGPRGNLVMPVFSFTVVHNGFHLNPEPAPFDPATTPSQTGALTEFFRKMPDVLRSRHPTHSVAVLGPDAKEIIANHDEAVSPCNEEGPWGKLLQLNSKILFFGADIGSMTFLHALEDFLDLPYLVDCLAVVKTDQGEGIIKIPKYPENHRDFYNKEPKIFKQLAKRGIVPKTVKLGLGELKLFDMQELYENGMLLLKKDPNILLCNDKNCSFCSKWNKK